MRWFKSAILFLLAMPFTVLAGSLSDIENISFSHAYSYHQQGDSLTALSLMLASREMKHLGEDESDIELFLAARLAEMGVVGEALRIYHSIADHADSVRMQDTAWLEYAKLSHQLGRHKEALKALAKIKKSMRGGQQQERLLIQAHAYLAAGNVKDAVKALPKISDDSLWAMYQYFNIGVELIERHRSKHGALVLHHLTKLDVKGQTEREAVRDQAALALGFSLLKMNKASKARFYFDKVTLDGHLSGIALLGMGWAYSQSGDYEKALVYWLELQLRASNSAYSYESLLAVPYAYSKAGAYKQSIEQYKMSQKRIDTELIKLTNAQRSIESGNLAAMVSTVPNDELAWYEKLAYAASALESRVMPLLMANPAFQNSLMEYRTLLQLSRYVRQMEAQLDELQQRPSAGRNRADVQKLNQRYKKLAQQIHLSLNANLQQLEQQAIETLARYKVQLDTYIEQARFGMAQAIEGAVVGTKGDR